MGRAKDVKELEAHLESVREAMGRARSALKEASAAERILTARIEELARGTDSVAPPVFPVLEEPTILTTDHALRRTRKETVLIALAGAGVALGAAALTVVVVVALRPARETASPANVPALTAPAPSPVRAIPLPEPAPEATAEAPAPSNPPPVRAPSIPAPKLEAPALGAALKPASTDDCTTRYTYDQNGIKHYKTHCLGF